MLHEGENGLFNVNLFSRSFFSVGGGAGSGVGFQGKSGGGGGHKGRWDPTDDGSEAQAVDGIADKGDPNYDSEADDHDNNYVLVCMPALCCFLLGTRGRFVVYAHSYRCYSCFFSSVEDRQQKTVVSLFVFIGVRGVSREPFGAPLTGEGGALEAPPEEVKKTRQFAVGLHLPVKNGQKSTW